MFKAIYFEFNPPLGKEKEDVLVSFFKDRRSRTLHKLKRGSGVLNWLPYRLAGGKTAEMIRRHFDHISDNIKEVFKFEDRGRGKYAFLLDAQTFGFFDGTVGLKSVRRLLGRKASALESIQDGVIGDFKAQVCPKIGFKPSEVKIVFGEE